METKHILALLIVGSVAYAVTPTWAEEESTSKDLTLEQKPVFDVQPSRPAASGLTVSAWTDKNTFQSGEAVRLHVKPSHAAYITVIDVGTSGSKHQIYPNANDPARLVAAGETLTIPSTDTYNFNVGGPSGKELLKVVATEDPSPVVPDQDRSKGLVFDEVASNTGDLAKDLVIQLNTQHDGKAATYNKVIQIE